MSSELRKSPSGPEAQVSSDDTLITHVSGVGGPTVADALDTITGNTGDEIDDDNSGAAKTIDLSAGPYHLLTLTADCTLTIIPPDIARSWQLRVINGNGGGWDITWPAGTRAPGGAILLTGSAGSEDIISGFWNGTVHEITVTSNMQAIP